MLSDKAPAGELDKRNKKRLHNLFGKFLYRDKAIDPTMLMALNLLMVVQKNPKTETAKQITYFLNYSVTHPDTET